MVSPWTATVWTRLSLLYWPVLGRAVNWKWRRCIWNIYDHSLGAWEEPTQDWSVYSGLSLCWACVEVEPQKKGMVCKWSQTMSKLWQSANAELLTNYPQVNSGIGITSCCQCLEKGGYFKICSKKIRLSHRFMEQTFTWQEFCKQLRQSRPSAPGSDYSRPKNICLGKSQNTGFQNEE